MPNWISLLIKSRSWRKGRMGNQLPIRKHLKLFQFRCQQRVIEQFFLSFRMQQFSNFNLIINFSNMELRSKVNFVWNPQIQWFETRQRGGGSPQKSAHWQLCHLTYRKQTFLVFFPISRKAYFSPLDSGRHNIVLAPRFPLSLNSGNLFISPPSVKPPVPVFLSRTLGSFHFQSLDILSSSSLVNRSWRFSSALSPIRL